MDRLYREGMAAYLEGGSEGTPGSFTPSTHTQAFLVKPSKPRRREMLFTVNTLARVASVADKYAFQKGVWKDT